MKTTTLDVETTTFQKGNPFSRRNALCCVGWKMKGEEDSACARFDYETPVESGVLQHIQGVLDRTDFLVGFNIKFDLHWLRRYGLIWSRDVRIWDCQIAQFVIEAQSKPYPSLDNTASYWNLPYNKINTVKEEYWDRGLDTTEVPWELLSEYACRDVDLTYSIYEKQQQYLRQHNPTQRKLINLMCQDLLVLEEMEWNGLKYNVEKSNAQAGKLQAELASIDGELVSLAGPYPWNFNSGDHLSCLLYGGTVVFKHQLPPEQYTFKSGKRAGQTVERFRVVNREVVFPQLIKPKPEWTLKKEGFFATSDGVLKECEGRSRGKAKRIVQLLRQRSVLEKLISTYYVGFPKKIVEMDWQDGEIHSQLNQVSVVTGRLSSNGPNQQNIPSEVYKLVETRF